MPIEIDQSNKIERTERDTILALSDGEKRVIVIPAEVKRHALAWMKSRRGYAKTAYLHIFAAGVFILLRPCLASIIKRREQIVIDTEYTGQDSKIKGMLLRHVHAAGFQLHKEAVLFLQVGKRSNAHRLASAVQHGKQDPDHCITWEEIEELLK